MKWNGSTLKSNEGKTEALKKLVRRESHGHSFVVSELLELTVKKFGGQEKLVEFMVQTIQKTKSDQVRARLLDSLMRLIQFETKDQAVRRPAESDMTDEDLELELREFQRESQNAYVDEGQIRTDDEPLAGEGPETLRSSEAVQPAPPFPGVPQVPGAETVGPRVEQVGQDVDLCGGNGLGGDGDAPLS